jgi:cardiolipin synthase A/B
MGIRQKVGQFMPEPNTAKTGNDVQLLVNGEQYFPALLHAIEHADKEVRIETYIFADDVLGQRVCESLCNASRRGVEVRLVVDGFGASNAVTSHLPLLEAAGVHVRVFRPKQFVLSPNPRRLRRMHRKLAVVDQKIAFVGGINLIDDFNHDDEQACLKAAEIKKGLRNDALLSCELGPRYDFAVQLRGPVVMDVWKATEWMWWQIGPGGKVTETLNSDWWRQRTAQLRKVLAHAALAEPLPVEGSAKVRLLLRDNFRFRRSIEKAYLKAIGESDREFLLANAYFIPGRKVRKALKLARKRGVTVRLLLQGQIEYHFQHYATQALYSQLLQAGVEIYEYLPGFLHGKVAVADNYWATVGSSNLDPLSFLLAREANVTIVNSPAVAQLRDELIDAMENRSRRVLRQAHLQRPLRTRLYSWFCYGLMRLAVTLGGMNSRY